MKTCRHTKAYRHSREGGNPGKSIGYIFNFHIGLFLFSCFFATSLQAQIDLSGILEQAIELPINKQLEMAKKTKIEELQNDGINAGLYLQGLPVVEIEGKPQFDPLYILRNHFGNGSEGFCDEKAATEAGAGFACRSDPLIAHGDIKFSTLVSGGNVLKEPRDLAVKWFIQNLIEPYPNTTFTDPEALKSYVNDPSKGPEVVQALVQQALLSVARQPFAEMVAKRMPVGEKGLSIMEGMEEVATKKFFDKKWNLNLTRGYEAAIKKANNLEPLYDIAYFEAYRAWLEFERYKQGERIEALLSAILVQIASGEEFGKGVASQTKETPVTGTGVIKGTEQKIEGETQ